MALTFLIDTSVIKRLGQPNVRQAVEPLAASGELARARISDLEVGYSARNEAEWDRLIGALDAFEPNRPNRIIVARFRCNGSLLSEASAAARSLTYSSPPPAKNTD